MYYLDLFGMTPSPVGRREIERNYDLTSVVRGVVPEAVRALTASDGPAPEPGFHDLRLEVVPPSGRPILLEADGTVTGAGPTHRLGFESRRRLRRLLFSAFPED